MRDITERKQADNELRRLATIVNSVSDPIIAIDTESRITVWNKGAEELYGYPMDEVLGGSVDVVSPQRVKAVQVANAVLTLKGIPLPSYETQKIKKSGEIIDVTTTGSPIFDQDGSVIGAVGIHRDITNQKRAERALRESDERFKAQMLEEKTRAVELQVRKTQQLQTIFEIGGALAGSGDLQTKAEMVSNIIQEQFEADGVALRMLDDE